MPCNGHISKLLLVLSSSILDGWCILWYLYVHLTGFDAVSICMIIRFPVFTKFVFILQVLRINFFLITLKIILDRNHTSGVFFHLKKCLGPSDYFEIPWLLCLQMTSNLTMASSPEPNFGVNIQEEMNEPYVKAIRSQFDVPDDKLVEAIEYLGRLVGGKLHSNRKYKWQLKVLYLLK